MKRTLVVLIFMGLIIAVPIQSEALIFPDYTGVWANKNQGRYYPTFVERFPTHGITGWDQDGGTAFEFNVTQSLHIDSLLFDASTFDGVSGHDENYDFLFALYTDGAVFRPTINPPTDPNVPDQNSLALTSDVHFSKKIVPASMHYQGFYYDDINVKDYSIPFNIDLEPGKYWIAGESQRWIPLVYSNVRLDGVVTPEPATMLLFGSGLLGAFVRRRKRV